MKRVFDIAMALWAGLLLCLPLLAVWLVVRLTSPGPALYWSDRVGRHNRIFSMPKFRTMRIGTPAVATHLLTDPDTYLTPVGSFLRKSSLDELPQLWSILVGDMSFVGPRPERPEFVAELAKAIPYYELRHYVKPGITGWAQILYPYGASINDSREKLQYDLYYLKNYSIFLDINILLQTVQVILWRKGSR